MDFGLQIVGLPAAEMLATARKAEAWGFSAVYVPDHLAYEYTGGGGMDASIRAWEATTILGAIATATRRVRVGSLVLCNLLRSPGLTAQATTTLDHLSGGRALLGLGSGWTRAEFEMMGLPFPDVKARLCMLDEAVRIIKRLWTEEQVGFHGEHYRLEGAISVPKPVQQPHPPVMLGGGGKGLLRIAAREADLVNVIAEAGRAGTLLPAEVARLTEQGLLAKLDFLRSEMRAAGRDPAATTISTLVLMHALTESAAAARDVAAGMGAMFGLTAEQVLCMPMALIGTPEACAVEIRRREREWGVTHLILAGLGGPDFVERFAYEVMPRV